MAVSAESLSPCVLVADAAASTALQEKLGASEARRAVERCLNRIERAAVAHRGRLTKAGDDQILAVFDSAEEALLAACDMQQKIDDLPPVSGHKFAIRVGMDCGEPAEQGDAVTGATRFARMAMPGQVIISDHAARQLPLPCLASLRQLDSVKRTPEIVQLWEALWRGGEEQARVPNHFAPTQQMEFKLRLYHGEAVLFVAKQRNTVILGRDKQSDVVIRDLRASRHHARIELRRDKFVLIDESSNGTWILTQADGSHAVKQQEVVLRGKGRISFGQAYREGVSDFVDYIVID